eukprot:COSAG01_NODE_4311_length_5142_cov_10.132263_3_plen_70_part_00
MTHTDRNQHSGLTEHCLCFAAPIRILTACGAGTCTPRSCRSPPSFDKAGVPLSTDSTRLGGRSVAHHAL